MSVIAYIVSFMGCTECERLLSECDRCGALYSMATKKLYSAIERSAPKSEFMSIAANADQALSGSTKASSEFDRHMEMHGMLD